MPIMITAFYVVCGGGKGAAFGGGRGGPLIRTNMPGRKKPACLGAINPYSIQKTSLLFKSGFSGGSPSKSFEIKKIIN
jgi:hypothetical protein